MKKKTLFGLLGIAVVAGIVAYAVKKLKEVDDFDFDEDDFEDDYDDWEDADIAAEFDDDNEFLEPYVNGEKSIEELIQEEIKS